MMSVSDPHRVTRSLTGSQGKRGGQRAARSEAVAANISADRAERIASIADDRWALGDVAVAVAVRDPDRAERIAARITDAEAKSEALVQIAQAWLDNL